MNTRTQHILITAVIAVIAGGAYIGSYLSFRTHHIEVWEQDRQAYVIFPRDRVFVYYLYRPLTSIDAQLTGMRFHIGSH